MQAIHDIQRFRGKMRRKPTKAEAEFCDRLVARGGPFKTQLICGFYILDVVLKERMIVFEIDGESHDKRKEYDERRDTFLTALGFKVIHVRNEDVTTYDLSWIESAPAFRDWVFRRALSRANVMRGRAIKPSMKGRYFRDVTYEDLLEDKNAVV